MNEFCYRFFSYFVSKKNSVILKLAKKKNQSGSEMEYWEEKNLSGIHNDDYYTLHHRYEEKIDEKLWRILQNITKELENKKKMKNYYFWWKMDGWRWKKEKEKMLACLVWFGWRELTILFLYSFCCCLFQNSIHFHSSIHFISLAFCSVFFSIQTEWIQLNRMKNREKQNWCRLVMNDDDHHHHSSFQMFLQQRQ